MSLFGALDLSAFILGLLFGSFLNVVIARVPARESVVLPRSRCPNCYATIHWYDNIPVLSWILLRARCRACGERVAWSYPAVELASALWLAAIVFVTLRSPLASTSLPISADRAVSLTLNTVSLAVLGLFLIALIVIDWRHQLLPDVLTFSGIAVSFLITCTAAIFIDPRQAEIHLQGRNPLTSPGATIDRGNLLFTGPEAFLGQWLISVVGAAAVLLVIRGTYRLLRGREGMGLGDVKLIAMISAFLGFWPAMLALLLGLLLATTYAIYLLIWRRADGLTRLPFGSFLGAGGLLSALFGPWIIAWYKTLL